MIDLTKRALPDTIEVGGRAFCVHTDFRIWMRFVLDFEAWDKTGELDISYLFKDRQPAFRKTEDYAGIFAFAWPPCELPRTDGDGEPVKLYDYRLDSDYIYAAFYQQYHIDLLSAKLHWHVFRALFLGLTEGTRLHEIMGYRSYTGEKVKTHDEMYRRLRNAWELPVPESEEDRMAEEEFNRYFG